MKILSPAKVNLFLQVVGKRADGYHELVTLMCCISLYDVVSMDFGAKHISVHCSHKDVPSDEGNLAYKTAVLFYEGIKKKLSKKDRRIEAEGVTIFIDKQIPVAAGLGGGSSNAASVLAGMNRYYGKPFSWEDLNAIGRRIGADVPFLLHQKPAIAMGIGDKLKTYEGITSVPILVVCPNFQVSTGTVYKNLNLRLTKCEKALKHFPFRKQKFDISRHLCNDLETVTAARYPVIGDIKRQLAAQGAEGALMTGSGTTVFGLFADAASAERAFSTLARNRNWRLFLTDLLV